MKKPFRFLSKRIETYYDPFTGKHRKLVVLQYEASFWEGPIEAGKVGRYVTRRCDDIFFPDRRRFLNTAPSVSYFSSLLAAVGR